MNELREWLDKQVAWFLGGSSALPNTTAKDLDFVVLVKDELMLHYKLTRLGFTERCMFNINGQPVDYNVAGNRLFEKDNIDLIVMDSPELFQKWKYAGQICAELNLTNREDRLKVHHILLNRPSYVFTNPLKGKERRSVDWDI